MVAGAGLAPRLSTNKLKRNVQLPLFNVPMGGTWSGWTKMENSNGYHKSNGYHNGPAIFTFSLTNNIPVGKDNLR